MPRVDFSGERVDEIVLDEKGVPGVDEVDRDIIPDLKITVQSEEPLEATVHGIVECDGIKTVERSLSKEILVVVGGGEVHRRAKIWSLVWSPSASAEEGVEHTCDSKNSTLADSQVECTERVATGDFTIDEEIVLSKGGGAFPDSSSPGSHAVYGDLGRLVDTDSVEIESFDGETRELDEPFHNVGLPFSQTILYGGKLAELTLPIGMDTEGFKITELVEIRSPAAIGRYGGCGIRDDGTIFAIERGEHARCVPGIVDLNQFNRQQMRSHGSCVGEEIRTVKSLYSLKFHGKYFDSL